MHSKQVMENPRGLTQWPSLLASLFLTSYLPDGSTLEQMPHFLEKPRKGWRGVVLLAVVVSPAGLGGKGVTRRERQEGVN